MTHPIEKYEVVIVGAGPAGVTCANFLGLMGIKTLIVDREADILNIPRAIAVDEEGSRILQSIGVWEEFSKTLIEIDTVKMVSPYTGELIKLDTSNSVNGFSRCRTMKQPDLERVLHKGLDRFAHVTLKRLTDMTSFQDNGDNVVVDLCENNTKHYKVQCKFILACDGAKSPTREMLGYNLVGSTYDKDWVVLDTHNDLTPENRSTVEFTCDPKRSAVSMPAPNGGRRWEFILHADENPADMLSNDNIQSLLDGWHGKNWGSIEDLKIERKTVYTFSARVSDGFQKGNVVLIGDAAHVTPPFIGQGLMAGLRDTNNICWKIAMAVRGQTNREIVDTYEIERRRNAEDMIKLAVHAGSVIIPKNRFRAFVRDCVFGVINALPFVRERLWGEKSKLKPFNTFDKGFILPTPSVGELCVGAWYPQGNMLTTSGEHCLIDDALALNWGILGIGLDPSKHLSKSSAEAWEKWNGKLLTITQHGHEPELTDTNTQSLIDLEGIYQDLYDQSLCIIVRPDRHIAALVQANQLSSSLTQYMAMAE